MVRILLLAAVTATAFHAAVIRGIVVENQSGKPVMRARVALLPIAGTKGAEQSARTNRWGAFEFLYLAKGSYVIKVSRRGFMAAEHGQRQWNSAGLPQPVEEEGSEFLTIRMRRYGAMAGTVRDENDVGRAEWPVTAFRNTEPPRIAGGATADERGIYRIGGLEPGVYFVRTGPLLDDDIGYLPTFGQETLDAKEARPVRVYPEEDSRTADVRPIPGKLYSVFGEATTEPRDAPVAVTLVSEMGRKTVESHAFQFGALPPGDYELYAECKEVPGAIRFQAAYTRLRITADTRSDLSLQSVRETYVYFGSRQPVARSSIVLSARRKDLAGVGEQQNFKLETNRLLLAPGRWELLMTPPPGFYVSGFSGRRPQANQPRADGWNETTIEPLGGSVSFTLSDGPGTAHGVVRLAGEPVAGAPVYLEGYDAAQRKRTLDIQTVRTDMQGNYKFENLAPGSYRILATFEYLMPDIETMNYAGARQLQIDARANIQTDLDLYGLR